MEIGPGGLDLSPFARMIYKHPDGEVHFVQLNVNVAQRQLPLRLAVAGFPRAPLDDGTCPRISEMQLVAVPAEICRSYLVLTSGQVLFPFEDSPASHMMAFSCMGGVPHKGQQFIVSFSKLIVSLPLEGRPPSFLPFLAIVHATGCPCRLSTSDTANPALDVAAKLIQEQSHRERGEMSPQAAVVRPPAQLGVYALQALTDQDLNGHDPSACDIQRTLQDVRARHQNCNVQPGASACWTLAAGTVRTLACDTQRTLQDVRARHQNCNVQPGANACWTSNESADLPMHRLGLSSSVAGQ